MKKNHDISKKPSTKRRQLYNAPLHLKRKTLTAPLASTLAEKEGIKQLVIRKGDTIRVRKGSFKGIEGEVSKIDYNKMKLTVEGITFEKSDGSSQHFPIRASTCEIIALKNMKDKKRRAIVDRRIPETEEKEEVKTEGK